MVLGHDRAVAKERDIELAELLAQRFATPAAVTRWGWSTEKARMVAHRERDQLARFLRERGFRLD